MGSRRYGEGLYRNGNCIYIFPPIPLRMNHYSFEYVPYITFVFFCMQIYAQNQELHKYPINFGHIHKL